MKTECKILSYNIKSAPRATIERTIESYCNNSFFKERTINSISTTQLTDDPNFYFITIIYENRVKWLKIIFILFLLISTLILILNIIRIQSLA